MILVSSPIAPSQEDLRRTYDELRESSQQAPIKGDMSSAALEFLSSEFGANHDLPKPESGRDSFDSASSRPQIVDENESPLIASHRNGLPGHQLQPIEEFDRLYPHQPHGRLIALQGANGNCDSVVELQHVCDKRGIRPIFEYEEVTTLPSRFSATVSFGEQFAKTVTAHPTKKQAKEAVSKLALALLVPVQPVTSKKRKSEEVVPDVDKTENWVGLLGEYAQKNKLPHAVYQEYATVKHPVKFGCTVSIAGGPLEPFGAGLGPFPSKQTAKAAAAKEAVCWLRARGLLSQTPKKERKMSSPATIAGYTGLTPDVRDLGIAMKDDADLPVTVRLPRLAISLGFTQPRLETKPSTTDDGTPLPAAAAFYDAAVYFDQRDVAREPRLDGPIGQVRRVFGKKQARIACYQQAIQLLESIRRDRSV